MILLLCADPKNGLCFNHRRQSRDRLCRAEMLTLCGPDRLLWVTPETARLFSPEEQSLLRPVENPLAQAGEDDVVFAESGPLAPWQEHIRELYLFRWDKVYPADERLDLELSRWTLLECREFPGSSHEVITLEHYRP